MKDDYLWDPSSAPDPEVERLGLDWIAARQFVGQLHLLVTLPQVVGRTVARDGGNPAAECRWLAQVADAGIRRDEHVLHQVVHVTSGHPPQED